MTEPVFRELNKDDWQELSSLRLMALKECPGFFGTAINGEEHQPPEFWHGWLTRQGKTIFGLFIDNKLIGFQGIATYKLDSEAGVIWGSYILPEYRGRGYSEILYKACVEWGISYLPWKRIVVSHREDNLASKGANQRFGFKYTHSEPQTWHDGKTLDHIFYELDLKKLRSKK